MTWTFKCPVRTPEEQAAVDRLSAFIDDAARKKLAFIDAHRERLVEAFLAETGLLPSEAMLVQQDHGNGRTSVWIERRKPSEPAGL